MNLTVFVCTDLDRTLLPNGAQPESPGARTLFASMAARPETRLAYVTGRHRELVEEALRSYELPVPDYVIADVGASIYSLASGEWKLEDQWQQEIGACWSDLSREELVRLFHSVEGLRLQEEERQGKYKLSYYTAAQTEPVRLLGELRERLGTRVATTSLIWSHDAAAGVGLLDVLPRKATKLHAIEFLIERVGGGLQSTVFAGDSGNDLAVLTSHVPSVLVANAASDVRRQALRQSEEEGTLDALYLARGEFLGMNGNYSAGILEGLVHYLPSTADWFPCR